VQAGFGQGAGYPGRRDRIFSSGLHGWAPAWRLLYGPGFWRLNQERKNLKAAYIYWDWDLNFYAALIPAPSFPTGRDNSTKGVPIALTLRRPAAEWFHPLKRRISSWQSH
jgi:hypothetical protein